MEIALRESIINFLILYLSLDNCRYYRIIRSLDFFLVYYLRIDEDENESYITFSAKVTLL